MSINHDDRALIQLILVRGKSYDDIGGLLGTDRDSVRNRAHEALARLESVDRAQVDPFADYLLGQDSSPDASRKRLEQDGQMRDVAFAIRDQLVILAPEAVIPDIPMSAPPPEGRKPSKPAGPGAAGSSGVLEKLDPGRKTLLAGLILATALAAVVAVILLIDSSGEDTETVEAEPAATTAVLSPVAGQEGEGKLDFGFSGVDFAANVRITGLAQSRPNESYAIWLDGPIGSFPIQQASVSDSGEISGQISINQAIICFIAADFFTDASLSRTPNGDLARAIGEARRASGGRGDFPSYTGRKVLEGPILMPAESKDRINRTCSGQGS